MSDRLRSLQRIVVLQGQMKRLAEWKLAATERRKAAVEAEQAELASLIEGEALRGSLAALATRQVRRLAARAVTIDVEKNIQSAALLAVQGRHKMAEDRMVETAREERDRAERQALLALVNPLASAADDAN